MGSIVLITGGARSGKSSFAQTLAEKNTDAAYIATAVALDEEMESRIAAHKKSRPQSWVTYEAPYDMKSVFSGHAHSVYLVDCLTVYMTNFLFKLKCFDDDCTHERAGKAEKALREHIADILSEIERLDLNVIFVTNEVGSSIVPETLAGRMFRDAAGRINQAVAEKADEVWLVCCGQPLKIKG